MTAATYSNRQHNNYTNLITSPSADHLNTRIPEHPIPNSRQIVLADVAGFCFGVRRAVQITEKARAERFGKLTTLGMLVHNEQVISRMRQEGVENAPTLEEIGEGTVVLSAHGVAPSVLKQVNNKDWILWMSPVRL